MGSLPAPKRKQAISWKVFYPVHTWKFWWTVEVLTLKGLVTYYVLFFIHLESRRVSLAGMTPYAGHYEWMEQQASQPQPWRSGDFCEAADTCCMTVIRSSVLHFVNLSNREASKRSGFTSEEPELGPFAERWVKIGQRGMPVEDDSVWGAIH